MPKGKGIRKDKFGRNARMKRLNPYWAQEQTLRQAQGKAWKNSFMDFAS